MAWIWLIELVDRLRLGVAAGGQIPGLSVYSSMHILFEHAHRLHPSEPALSLTEAVLALPAWGSGYSSGRRPRLLVPRVKRS